MNAFLRKCNNDSLLFGFLDIFKDVKNRFICNLIPTIENLIYD